MLTFPSQRQQPESQVWVHFPSPVSWLGIWARFLSLMFILQNICNARKIEYYVESQPRRVHWVASYWSVEVKRWVLSLDLVINILFIAKSSSSFGQYHYYSTNFSSIIKYARQTIIPTSQLYLVPTIIICKLIGLNTECETATKKLNLRTIEQTTTKHKHFIIVFLI